MTLLIEPVSVGLKILLSDEDNLSAGVDHLRPSSEGSKSSASDSVSFAKVRRPPILQSPIAKVRRPRPA